LRESTRLYPEICKTKSVIKLIKTQILPKMPIHEIAPKQDEEFSTPSKRARLSAIPTVAVVAAVTPSVAQQKVAADVSKIHVGNARRAIFPTQQGDKPAAVTPTKVEEEQPDPPAKRKLVFGRMVNETIIQDNVRQVYGIVKKLTGSIGGNGSHGPIYGELTMGSMQKMINLMKVHTGFSSKSQFIDVGSGIGKPNLHVAQDPGVEFSYGIEVETDRWLLGLSCLKGVLGAAKEQSADTASRIMHKCYFEQGDIRTAKTFDPFTHVYMFSIG
jgi:hypothetical protein